VKNTLVLLIMCFADPQDGELELFPLSPRQTNEEIVSTSFGVVGIFFKKKWRAIGSKTSFEGASNLADLMCHSLGFQKAATNGVKPAIAFGNEVNLTNSSIR